jgi:hypothetical protein
MLVILNGRKARAVRRAGGLIEMTKVEFDLLETLLRAV